MKETEKLARKLNIIIDLAIIFSILWGLLKIIEYTIPALNGIKSFYEANVVVGVWIIFVIGALIGLIVWIFYRLTRTY